MRKLSASDLSKAQTFKQASRDSKVAAGFFCGKQKQMESSTMDIEHWRNEIDALDQELLRLLNQRARLAIKVGSLKKAANLPFCDPERERQVLGRLEDLNDGPLDTRAVRKMFRRIIRESRRIEVHTVESHSQTINQL